MKMPSLKRKRENELRNNNAPHPNDYIQVKTSIACDDHGRDTSVNSFTCQSSAVMQKRKGASVTNKRKKQTFRNLRRKRSKKTRSGDIGVDVLCDSRGTEWKVTPIPSNAEEHQSEKNCAGSEISYQSNFLTDRNGGIIYSNDSYDSEPVVKKRKFEIPERATKIVNNLSKKKKRKQIESCAYDQTTPCCLGQPADKEGNISKINWRTLNGKKGQEICVKSFKKNICNSVVSEGAIQLFNTFTFQNPLEPTFNTVGVNEMQPDYEGNEINVESVNLDDYELQKCYDEKNLKNIVCENNDSHTNVREVIEVEVEKNIPVPEKIKYNISQKTDGSGVKDEKRENNNEDKKIVKIDDLKLKNKIDEHVDTEEIKKSNDSEEVEKEETEIMLGNIPKMKLKQLDNKNTKWKEKKETEKYCETRSEDGDEEIRNKENGSNKEDHLKVVVTKEDDDEDSLINKHKDTRDVGKLSDSELENEKNVKRITCRKAKKLRNGRTKRKEKNNLLQPNQIETMEIECEVKSTDCDEVESDDEDSVVGIKKRTMAKIIDSDEESNTVITKKEEEGAVSPAFSEESDENEKCFGKIRKKVIRVLTDIESEEEDGKENVRKIHRKNRIDTAMEDESLEEKCDSEKEEVSDFIDDGDTSDEGDGSGNSDDDDNDDSGADESACEDETLNSKRKWKKMAMEFVDAEAEEGEETEDEEAEEEEEIDEEETEKEESEDENDERKGVERFIDIEAKEETTFIRRKKRKNSVIDSEEEGDEEKKEKPIEPESLEKTVHIMKKLTRIMTFGQLRRKTLKKQINMEESINEANAGQTIGEVSKSMMNWQEDIEDVLDNTSVEGSPQKSQNVQLSPSVKRELRLILGEGNEKMRKRKHGKSEKLLKRGYVSDSECRRIKS